ncbi:hypothetical protein ACFVTP_29355 [Streptomyces celluloflavus]|uniref:hypothetical protein n=1 Tax=Streptomyces celluloflavus TaxID=58344 RepID=UPI0036D896F0
MASDAGGAFVVAGCPSGVGREDLTAARSEIRELAARLDAFGVRSEITEDSRAAFRARGLR